MLNMGGLLFVYLFSLFGFCLSFNFLLNALIMMEFIVVSLLMLMVEFDGVFIYLLFYLILSVCEGILGLLILIKMYRLWGFDSFQLVDYSMFS